MNPPADPSTAALAAAFPGIDGFLGTRASLGMDVVVVGLFALLPLLAWSVARVRRGDYGGHKRLQLVIVAALAAAIVVFEIDVRLVSDWKIRARGAGNVWWPTGVLTALGVHLVFAVSSFVLLAWVTWEAVTRFPVPPAPVVAQPVRALPHWDEVGDEIPTDSVSVPKEPPGEAVPVPVTDSGDVWKRAAFTGPGPAV